MVFLDLSLSLSTLSCDSWVHRAGSQLKKTGMSKSFKVVCTIHQEKFLGQTRLITLKMESTTLRTRKKQERQKIILKVKIFTLFYKQDQDWSVQLENYFDLTLIVLVLWSFGSVALVLLLWSCFFGPVSLVLVLWSRFFGPDPLFLVT